MPKSFPLPSTSSYASAFTSSLLLILLILLLFPRHALYFFFVSVDLEQFFFLLSFVLGRISGILHPLFDHVTNPKRPVTSTPSY